MIDTTSVEVEQLVSDAHQALVPLAERGHAWRSHLLRSMAEHFEGSAPAIVEVAEQETRLGAPRLDYEVRRTCFQLRLMAEVVDEGSWLDCVIDHPSQSAMGELPDLRRMQVPRGVIGIFGASNFPLASSVPGSDTASAIAAGCPVVIKAHPGHPVTSSLCFDLLKVAADSVGAPEGMLSLVSGFDAGVALVESQRLAAVGFTGSRAGGEALFRRCSARPVPIPFYGELGAANPLVVTEGAAGARHLEIAQGLARALTQGSGQFCTKPGLCFLPSGPDGDQLVTELVAALKAIGPLPMLNGSIEGSYLQARARLGALSEVGSLVSGSTDESGTTPTLLETNAEHFSNASGTALLEECFGPIGVVVRYGSVEELFAALETAEPALCFSVFSEPDEAISAALLALGATKAGRVLHDRYPPGAPLSWAMVHGGPFPATTAAEATSMGAASLGRWLRPVAFQNVPDHLLPIELKEENLLDLPRRVDSKIVV
jgi:NADP-dependent aldehyde dehydrogenase